MSLEIQRNIGMRVTKVTVRAYPKRKRGRLREYDGNVPEETRTYKGDE